MSAVEIEFRAGMVIEIVVNVDLEFVCLWCVPEFAFPFGVGVPVR